MARIVIGALFVISGITKDIDLWGTVYKIEEYLNIWDMQQPRTIVFMAAIMLSGAGSPSEPYSCSGVAGELCRCCSQPSWP